MFRNDPSMILQLHFTKVLKRDNIYKLCLCIIEEHSCLILTALACAKLRYDTHVPEYTLFLQSAELLRHNNIYIVFMNARRT